MRVSGYSSVEDFVVRGTQVYFEKWRIVLERYRQKIRTLATIRSLSSSDWMNWIIWNDKTIDRQHGHPSTVVTWNIRTLLR